MTRTYDDSPPDDFDSAPQFAWPRMTPVVRALIWSNVIVFALFELLSLVAAPTWETLQSWFELNTEIWRENLPLVPVWQLLSYGFLHSVSDPFHILFNLLGLFFFGTMVEGLIGSRRYLFFYLAAIAIGGGLQLVYSFATGHDAHVVGASGGVLATIVGAAVLRPNARVIFIVFPLSLRVLALILVGLNLFSFARGQDMQVALVVHLGGAAWGFCALRFGWIWADPAARWRERRQRVEVAERESEEQRLDKLLQQIHEKGMTSLSERDREFLKRMSSRR